MKRDLQTLESNFKTIVDNTLDAVFVNDINGNYVYVNNEAVRLSGYSKEELLTLNIADLTPPKYLEETLKRIKNRLIGKDAVRFLQTEMLAKGNTTIPIEITITAINWNGEPAEVVFARDITERKLLEEKLIKAKEEAEKNERIKTAFLATISHELRTPLNAIIGFSELINPDMSMDDIMEYVSIVKRSGEHLLDMINSVFELSLLIAGESEIHIQTVDLVQVVHFVNTWFLKERKMAGKENINYFFDLPSGQTSLLIKTDKSKLFSILKHLLSNALKFTHKGEIKLTLKPVYNGDKKIKSVLFSVKDTGIGIDKKKQDIIFDVFRQVDDTSTRSYEGLGIGLALAKKLTDVLNGTIYFESEPEKGSIFFVELPNENK